MNKEEDAESVVSDCSLEPQHRSNSKKWIIRDGSYKQPRVLASEMKTNFKTHENLERYFVGIRRGKAFEKFTQEIGDQIIEENNLPVPIEEYCTEYDSNYHDSTFDSNKKNRDRELFLKYPLYSSEPFTFYKNTLDKELRGEARLFGHTYSKRPFKKCAQFTKEQSGDCSY